MKTLPHNIGIATEIASISVSVAKLLVLPVLVTVSTSGLRIVQKLDRTGRNVLAKFHEKCAKNG